MFFNLWTVLQELLEMFIIRKLSIFYKYLQTKLNINKKYLFLATRLLIQFSSS